MSQFSENLISAEKLIQTCLASQSFLKSFDQFQALLIDAVKNGKNVFVCGNGGSHCDAMHFAEEFTGRFKKDRRALGALALGDPSHLTCVSNDFGFQFVFSRQVEGLGREGDLLIGISTSGNSENIIEAVKTAKAKKMKTIALLGKSGGKIAPLVDISVVVPSESTERIQEIHIKIIHSVIEGMEKSVFAELYS
jgi:D-sedoheptulose 7-phosphate isomerase